MLMDRFATPSECWQQAALCRARADAAADERLRAVWMSMTLIWTKLAAGCVDRGLAPTLVIVKP